MARKNENEEHVLSVAARKAIEKAEQKRAEDETPVPENAETSVEENEATAGQKTMMEQLRRMQEELQAKMEALDKRETELIHKGFEQEKRLKELNDKEARLETREVLITAKEADAKAKSIQTTATSGNEPQKPADPWKENRTLFVPRGRAGEQQFVYVSINGKAWKVPRGRSVEMPLPVYERLVIMLERDAAAQRYRDSVPENGEINTPSSKATRA